MYPISIWKELQKDKEFKKWKKEHSDSFLSHFFCPIHNNGEAASSWEIGFILPANERIVIFVKESSSFTIKMEDDIFKEPNSRLETLNLKKVKVEYSDAFNLLKEELPKLFPKEAFNDGFVILQSLNNLILWNFSFVTQSLKFVNVKIDAVAGKISDSQLVSVMDNQAKRT